MELPKRIELLKEMIQLKTRYLNCAVEVFGTIYEEDVDELNRLEALLKKTEEEL